MKKLSKNLMKYLLQFIDDNNRLLLAILSNKQTVSSFLNEEFINIYFLFKDLNFQHKSWVNIVNTSRGKKELIELISNKPIKSYQKQNIINATACYIRNKNIFNPKLNKIYFNCGFLDFYLEIAKLLPSNRFIYEIDNIENVDNKIKVEFLRTALIFKRLYMSKGIMYHLNKNNIKLLLIKPHIHSPTELLKDYIRMYSGCLVELNKEIIQTDNELLLVPYIDVKYSDLHENLLDNRYKIRKTNPTNKFKDLEEYSDKVIEVNYQNFDNDNFLSISGFKHLVKLTINSENPKLFAENCINFCFKNLISFKFYLHPEKDPCSDEDDLEIKPVFEYWKIILSLLLKISPIKKFSFRRPKIAFNDYQNLQLSMLKLNNFLYISNFNDRFELDCSDLLTELIKRNNTNEFEIKTSNFQYYNKIIEILDQQTPNYILRLIKQKSSIFYTNKYKLYTELYFTCYKEENKSLDETDCSLTSIKLNYLSFLSVIDCDSLKYFENIKRIGYLEILTCRNMDIVNQFINNKKIRFLKIFYIYMDFLINYDWSKFDCVSKGLISIELRMDTLHDSRNYDYDNEHGYRMYIENNANDVCSKIPDEICKRIDFSFIEWYNGEIR